MANLTTQLNDKIEMRVLASARFESMPLCIAVGGQFCKGFGTDGGSGY